MGVLYATVTIDWEGIKLEDDCLNYLEFFKKQFSEIPLTHFLCPAYFTRGKNLAAQIKKMQTLTKDDEIGLHIHSWKSLITKSSVEPQLQPNCHPKPPKVTYGDGKKDEGFAVPLGIYTIPQIRQILRTSKQILIETDITATECVSFRCGAWFASDAVFSALAEEGFKNDASAVPPNWLSTVTESALPIFASWIRHLWGKHETKTPHYLANTLIHRTYPKGIQSCLSQHEHSISQPQILANDIVEVPDTGLLMDYTPPSVLYHYIQQAWKLSKQTDTYISFGFHLESANASTTFSENIPFLIGLIQVLLAIKQEGIHINYLKLNQVRETL
jgi:hypothetical protein